MSLVGSLEDLGLVDILQIVSLARKSGTLALRSESGDGRIVLRDGLVRGAAIKGGVEDLRGLLIAEGCVDAASFEEAREIARADRIGIDEALDQVCGIESEQLSALRREHVERSVMRMLGWHKGEFCFEIRDEVPHDEDDLLLSSGLNTQYLAMEATRLDDESREPLDVGDGDLEDDDFLLSGEDPQAEAALDAMAAATARAVLEAAEDEDDAMRGVADIEIDSAPVGNTRVPVSVADETRISPRRVLVAIDPDLSSLEWLKEALRGTFRRTHIFQRRDAALMRIRQYLVRGTVPVVLMSEASDDGVGPETADLAARLRGLAPGMPVLALRPESCQELPPAEVDGVLYRPDSPSPDPSQWGLHQSTAENLRADLAVWLGSDRAIMARRRARAALARLESARDRLGQPEAQAEVVKAVLDFAAETFDRVAIFLVRDGVAVGMAQRRLPETGGPADEEMRECVLGPEAMPDLFRDALARRAPVVRTPESANDRRFAESLGTAIPGESFAAPLEGADAAVAIVYADNLPSGKPLPDAAPVEIVLREAGPLLDGAVLARVMDAGI